MTEQMAAEQATYSSATIGRGFSADVSARIAHGRLQDKKRKRQEADFLTHLFVDRQLSIPVVLRTTVNSVWKTHGRQKAVDPLWASGSKHSLWKDPRPQPSYGLLIAIAFKARSYDTAFPLLLAAARRRGDIHVVDVRRDVRPVALTSQTSHYDSKYRLLAERSAIA